MQFVLTAARMNASDGEVDQGESSSSTAPKEESQMTVTMRRAVYVKLYRPEYSLVDGSAARSAQ